ncbi:MAG: type III pantothenate kinase, partial [Lachnospiraceae bacterium]|nr:type III pantothenate kinase [Lachnospiraceae bacterium]
GAYIGGSILPGAGISMKALARETALLPAIDIVPPKKTIASNTVDAMKAGIVFGQAGAIDGTIDRFAAALGREPASIVTTGGMGSVICPHCMHEITIDDTLLLKGLGIIWKKNAKNKLSNFSDADKNLREI